ncbi:hypothetical protein CCACVL1_30733 [Corchorus capsularis]|uniref:Uncharacterized protein n=1 Tax=Corchorus capsularis TaxID=210143 RepID=A0A1R3FVV8_COCAP|nr:hypothetical protein CCACVL1_30733 [Corchorus capsularis]
MASLVYLEWVLSRLHSSFTYDYALLAFCRDYFRGFLGRMDPRAT